MVSRSIIGSSVRLWVLTRPGIRGRPRGKIHRRGPHPLERGLFGSSTAHKTLRKLLVEGQKLDAVISLPGGAFKPYAGVSTAILLFTKTNSGGTDHVWFYDVVADGWSLDDKRQPLLSEDKLGPVPVQPLSAEEHGKNNLPDVLARWQQRDGGRV
jgi:type I restriction enzyme M protein